MPTLEERNEVLQAIKSLSNYFEKTKNKLYLPYNLSSVQADVLMDINRNQNSKVTDICRRLNKSTNTISPIINRLVKNGFLYKEKMPTDSRIVLVKLTKKSMSIMDNIEKDIEEFTWPIFDRVPKDIFREIYTSLKKLENIIGDL